MVTQLQPDVRAYLHGAEVIKRFVRVEEVQANTDLILKKLNTVAPLSA